MDAATLLFPEPHIPRPTSTQPAPALRPRLPTHRNSKSDSGTSPSYTSPLHHRDSITICTNSSPFSSDPADWVKPFQNGSVPESEQEWAQFVPPQALEVLDKHEVERQSVLFEVFKSELDYVNDLQTMQDVYVAPMLDPQQDIIEKSRRSTVVTQVFGGLDTILTHHRRMLAALFERQREQHPLVQSVTDVILGNVLQFGYVYETYIKHSPFSLAYHKQELERNNRYASFIQGCSEDPRLKRRDFKALLSRPLTRLPRIKLIMERIEKLTPEGHDDRVAIPTLLSALQSYVKSSEPGIAAAEDKVGFWAVCESLIYSKGEITDLDLYAESRTLIHSGPLARQRSDTWRSWTNAFGALLDNYFLLLKEEGKPPGTARRRIVSRPIPLEYLRLGSFNGQPEVRKERADNGSFINMSSTKQDMYPFSIYHAGARAARGYTLYTPTAVARERWRAALTDAIAVRKVAQEASQWFSPQALNDGFFRAISPRVPLVKGSQFTGRVCCAAPFSYQERSYLAVGCATGIYIGMRADSSFRKILPLAHSTTMLALPQFNRFLVHHETTLLSYPLDLLVQVYLGNGTTQSLNDSAEKPAQDDGNVLFLKAGRIREQSGSRTLIVFATKGFSKHTLHTKELVDQQSVAYIPGRRRTSAYRTFGLPMPIPRDSHDVTFIGNKTVVCTSKTVHILRPTNTATFPSTVVPNFSEASISQNLPMQSLKEMCEAAKALGLVRSGGNEILVIYDELGCYIDESGKPVRSSGYIRWECRATTYARRGPHLLLFSPGFVEVRSISTGVLVQVIEGDDVRLLHSGIAPQDMLIVGMAGKRENESGLSERLVELVRTHAINEIGQTPRPVEVWDEW
ncbi:hypothetical protein BC834DRAFT_826441 [Gloeopeniophorella convolvens]|nr:hypothetical protein BC834DRAFT_826441 [Gloeopeniophorella convolvens]